MYVYSFIKKLTWRSLKHRNYNWEKNVFFQITHMQNLPVVKENM